MGDMKYKNSLELEMNCNRSGDTELKRGDTKCTQCDSVACYSINGRRPATECHEHKGLSMYHISAVTCLNPGCNISPAFGYTLTLFCSTHKKKDMVDCKHELCRFSGCNKHPSFNYTGCDRAIYCRRHKKSNMVNIIIKRCLMCADGIPKYNYPTKKTGEYCEAHKTDDMIEIKYSKCVYIGCNSIIEIGKSLCSYHIKNKATKKSEYDKLRELYCDKYVVDKK